MLISLIVSHTLCQDMRYVLANQRKHHDVGSSFVPTIPLISLFIYKINFKKVSLGMECFWEFGTSIHLPFIRSNIRDVLSIEKQIGDILTLLEKQLQNAGVNHAPIMQWRAYVWGPAKQSIYLGTSFDGVPCIYHPSNCCMELGGRLPFQPYACVHRYSNLFFRMSSQFPQGTINCSPHGVNDNIYGAHTIPASLGNR